MRPTSEIRVGTMVRVVLGSATVIAFVAALAIRTEPRLFVAAGAFGALWWGWDLLMEYVFLPLGDWMFGALAGGELEGRRNVNRLTLEDNIRLLESHLENPTSQQVDINSAIRLEEIYRTVKKDPDRARRAIERVIERYPDAPELQRYKKSREESEGDGMGREG